MIMTMIQILAFIYFIIALYYLIYSILEHHRIEKEYEEIKKRVEEALNDLTAMEDEE